MRVTTIWRFLLTDIRELNWRQAENVTKTGIDAAKAVFDLAKTFKEQTPNLKTLPATAVQNIGQISSLLDVLNTPLAQLAKDTLPFAPLVFTIMNLVREATHQDPTLEQCVVLVSQVAYLESLQALLRANPAILEKIGGQPVSKEVSEQIQNLGKLEFSVQDADRAIAEFHKSPLATAFNAVLQQRLQEAGLGATDAQTLSERVARTTEPFLVRAIAQHGDSVKPLANLYEIGGSQVLEKYLSLEDYLRDYISPDSTVPNLKDRWRVFDESFTLPDIYVPLQVQPLDRNGEPNGTPPVDLKTRAEEWLNQATPKVRDARNDRVLFIQGAPGRGKSAFCRMFADWVRHTQHPIWTPILIRLRDIRCLEKDFEETLQKAVDWDFARNDNGWLTDRHTRFLFLLDGFDELLMEGRSSRGLEEFLAQVGQFQHSCNHNPEKGHRVLVTGRTLALQSIERKMPDNLERLELLPMSQTFQQRWLNRWENLVGSNERGALQQFLQDPQCPEPIRGTQDKPGLAQEPLLLYLLAAMHRDGKLTLDLFADTEGTSAKILIYQRAIDWVLTRQRPELNRAITELDTENLRRILAEAALCVVQAGGECAGLGMIEARLKVSAVRAILEEARARIQDNPLRNALVAFYLQPGGMGKGSVEFIHKSFGEFLCAERLKESLEDWAKLGDKRREFYISQEEMEWELYDLLGYGGLTLEIVEYLMALLTASPEMDSQNWIRLFQRLHQFYDRWCDGQFIDAPPETNLPQKKMRQLQEQLFDQEQPLGLRQVDIFTGLNGLILLLCLYRYVQGRDDLKSAINFYPSGQVPQDDPGATTDRLLRIIHYANCLGLAWFAGRVGIHLAQANLVKVYLARAYLPNINLESANLESANFASANLNSANLSNTNLANAYIARANLEHINLKSANLTNTIFVRANIENANLTDANLTRANFASVSLVKANLTKANLTKTNMANANLAKADLTAADLTEATLDNANLTEATLTRATLAHTNLTEANLKAANLTQANLTRAFLDKAFLGGADLSYADLSEADLVNVVWDKHTIWDGVRGLERARNVPAALRRQLGM